MEINDNYIYTASSPAAHVNKNKNLSENDGQRYQNLPLITNANKSASYEEYNDDDL